MTITRRRTLGFASALAVLGGTDVGLASVMHSRMLRFRNLQSAQSFLLLLVHPDECNHVRYTAPIWIPSSDTAWYAVDTMTAAMYGATNSLYKKRGYRLERVSAFRTKEGVRYAAIWELVSGPEWQSRHGMSIADFNLAHGQYDKTWRMAHINAHERLSAIWEKGDGTIQQVLVALSRTDFESQAGQLTSQGFRPLRISTSAEGNTPRFTALFEKNNGSVWQSQHLMTAVEFDRVNARMLSRGYKMTDASGVMLGNKPSFTGIWEKI
jgi:hypothetical protein